MKKSLYTASCLPAFNKLLRLDIKRWLLTNAGVRAAIKKAGLDKLGEKSFLKDFTVKVALQSEAVSKPLIRFNIPIFEGYANAFLFYGEVEFYRVTLIDY